MTVPGEVVFIPDDKEVMRNEAYRDVKVHDLIENTNIHNVMKAERKAGELQNTYFLFYFFYPRRKKRSAIRLTPRCLTPYLT